MGVKKIKEFEIYLRTAEKSEATVEKYVRDVGSFLAWLAGEKLNKEKAIEYKAMLIEKYAKRSVNSIIASLNSYFEFLGRHELKIKSVKLQRQVYCSEEKELTREEYKRLVKAAGEKNNRRLSLIIQTICNTGIRVSELQYITVEAVKRGEATVSCKGKTRTVFIVKALRKKLIDYTWEKGIMEGCVFVTRNGKAVSRTNIWKDMKKLCRSAGVREEKVFPHNLRHLFARSFYGIDKDIAKLADILGHSSINTTRIYIITTGREHRRKMENLRLVI